MTPPLPLLFFHQSRMCTGTHSILVLRKRGLAYALFRRQFIGSTPHHTIPLKVTTETVIASSCNGLVILTRTLYTKLAVWNPSTGFYSRIPSPEFSTITFMAFGSITCGFGHDMATDDYKLVFFDHIKSQVHISSTRDWSWKVIEAPSRLHRHDRVPSLSNGALHWIAGKPTELSSPSFYISAFDLANEEFRELPLPPTLIKYRLNAGNKIRTQLLLEGGLCVWCRTSSHSEFWEMKEYGKLESWVKLFQFSLVDVPNDVCANSPIADGWYEWDPVFVTEDGTVVMDLKNLNWPELVRIECHSEEKPVCSGWYQIRKEISRNIMSYTVKVYDETLVSV